MCSSLGTSPGRTQFTRIPIGPSSTARARVRESIAPLVAEYTALPARVRSASVEPMLTTAPRESPSRGMAARVTHSVPIRLISTMSRISVSGVSARGANSTVPALFTTPSRRPCSSAIRDTSPATAPRSVTSHTLCTKPLRAASRSLSARRPQMMTRSPPSCSRSAIPAPIPVAPPVTRMIRSVMSLLPSERLHSETGTVRRHPELRPAGCAGLLVDGSRRLPA